MIGGRASRHRPTFPHANIFGDWKLACISGLGTVVFGYLSKLNVSKWCPDDWILDTFVWWTEHDARLLMLSLDDEGRSRYNWWHFLFDSWYPAVYCCFFMCLLCQGSKAQNWLGRCCRLFANLPRLCCFSDMCENAMIMRLCTGFYAPTFHKNLWFACEAGVVCTFTKWCLIILCLLLGGSGTASYWCVRLWRENRFGAGMIRRPSPRELAEIQSRRADYVEPIQPSS